MLQEEAYLKNELSVKDFYARMPEWTSARWIGPPKGDIEPVKAANADILLAKARIKPRGESIIERGGDPRAVAEQFEEEDEYMKGENGDPDEG